MTPFQFVVGLVLAISLFTTFLGIAQRRIGWRSGLFLGALWASGIALVALPELATGLGRWFGIGRGADLVFYFALLSGIYALLALFGRLRRLEAMIVTLTREVGIARVTQLRGATASGCGGADPEVSGGRPEDAGGPALGPVE